MGLMDADVPKGAEEGYGLGRQLVYSGIASFGFLCASVGWMLFGFAIFTAKNGYDWYYPVGGLIVLAFLGSGLWFVGSLVALVMGKWQRN